jgi:hypothetical protein
MNFEEEFITGAMLRRVMREYPGLVARAAGPPAASGADLL